MKRSATSSAGLPLPPSRRRKRDGVGRAEGERERQISRLRPATLGRVSGSRPPAYPIPTRPPWAHDPPDEGGERPQGPQAHLLRGSCRHHPPGPGLPGSNRLSIQLPVARSPGRARPTSPGRSPGLDFATYPTPEGEPREWAGGAGGGNQAQVGGRRRREDHLQRAGAGERGCGLAAPANQSPGVAPLPHHPHPLPSQVAHSSSGRCPLAFQSPWHSRNRKKTRHGRDHPQDPRRWCWGP